MRDSQSFQHKPKKSSRVAAAVIAATLAPLLWCGPALADIVIVGVEGAPYRRGQTLSDKDTLDLPAGARVMALLANNAVREIKGPYRGLVAELSKGRPSAVTGLWHFVTSYFTTGGSSVTPGATRSISKKPHAEEPQSIDVLPIDASGAFCASAATPVKLGRTATGSALDVTLAHVKTRAAAKVSFAKGQAEAPWPSQVPYGSSSYMITSGPHGLKPVELKLLKDEELKGDMVLMNLQQKGCVGQMKIWLATAGRN